jgi:predicted permease
MSLVGTFANAVLPILVVAGVGALLGRGTDVDAGPLNTVTIYVFAPALIFHGLVTTTLSGATLAKVGVGVVAYITLMAVVAAGVARATGRSEPTLSAVVLLATFPNCGNYGVPLSTFAFGETGRNAAILYLTGETVMAYTVGVYLASRTSGVGGVTGVKRILKLPLTYAVVAGALARWTGVVPPAGTTAMETLRLVGDATIPLMLVVLGIQLARADYGATIARVGSPALLKLFVAPVVAVVLALALGFEEPGVARTFVLESSMPTAVMPLVLLTEFSEATVDGVPIPQFASAVILVTTLASVPLLTGLIAVLESGVVI